MRAVVYASQGDLSVMRVEERPMAEPQGGEVRVRVAVSGVNPTDWKSRSRTTDQPFTGDVVPNHDGAGIVDAIGSGVEGLARGDRVWLTLAGHQRPASGTAQDYTVVPAQRAFPLPNGASFDLGASIGISVVTAHRALTVSEDGPRRLRRGALTGRTVLVAGGAGGVGNAAIQLARWAGANVIATVSSGAKARLATVAGADHTLDYTADDVGPRIRELAPDGVDTVVEVAAAANATLDLAVLKPRGTISIYANEGGGTLTPDVGSSNDVNARYQFILLYTVGWGPIEAAAEDINEAIAEGAFNVGEHFGLPLHHFALDDTAAAHDAVEGGAIGKVLDPRRLNSGWRLSSCGVLREALQAASIPCTRSSSAGSSRTSTLDEAIAEIQRSLQLRDAASNAVGLHRDRTAGQDPTRGIGWERSSHAWRWPWA